MTRALKLFNVLSNETLPQGYCLNDSLSHKQLHKLLVYFSLVGHHQSVNTVQICQFDCIYILCISNFFFFITEQLYQIGDVDSFLLKNLFKKVFFGIFMLLSSIGSGLQLSYVINAKSLIVINNPLSPNLNDNSLFFLCFDNRKRSCKVNLARNFSGKSKDTNFLNGHFLKSFLYLLLKVSLISDIVFIVLLLMIFLVGCNNFLGFLNLISYKREIM